MIKDKRIEKIAEFYGKKSQVRQTVEELAELIVAIEKERRFENRAYSCSQDELNTVLEEWNNSISHMSEEMADVYIMLSQLEYLYKNSTEIKMFIERKLDRQLDRMDYE